MVWQLQEIWKKMWQWHKEVRRYTLCIGLSYLIIDQRVCMVLTLQDTDASNICKLAWNNQLHGTTRDIWKHKMCTRKKIGDWWLCQDTARYNQLPESCKLA